MERKTGNEKIEFLQTGFSSCLNKSSQGDGFPGGQAWAHTAALKILVSLTREEAGRRLIWT